MLEIAGVVIGGMLVIAAIATWRLSTAPMEARFIEPYLEQQINKANLGFSVRVTEAKLVWRRLRPILDLHFHGVKVQGQGGVAVGALKDGTVSLSIPNLLRGRPSLIEIELEHPEITIIRDAADHYAIRVDQPNPGDKADAGDKAKAGDKANAGDKDSVGGADFIAQLKQLIEPANDDNPLGRLQRVRLVDGRVTVEDRKLGINWSAPDVDLDLARLAAGTTAQIHVDLALPQHAARLSGQVRYARADGKITLSLDVTDFDAAAAAPLAAELSPLAALAVPVSGQVHAVLDSGGRLLGGDASLRGNAGQIVLPSYYPQALAFQSVGLDFHFTGAPQRLTLDRLAIDLGDARLSATGAADFTGQTVAVDAHVDLANIPMKRLDAIWPQGVALGGRDWVTTHISEGTIKSGSVHVIASGPKADLTAIQPVIDGAFDYDGLDVTYFPALPPVRAVAGRGTFDTARMDLTIESGALNDIAISNGVIAITGLDQEDRAIDIGLSLDGPLKSVLAVLDMKPLGYAHDLGISPETVSGHLRARAKFAFPLISTLTFKQIALGAKGNLDGVAVPAVIGPRDVSAGAFAIALDKKGMTLNGTASLSGVPLSLDWQESFETTNPIRTRIAFKSELDDADRVALAIVPPDIVDLKGKVAVNGKVTIDRSRNITLDTTADLANADLNAGKFGLHKAVGKSGSADLSFLFIGDTLRQVSRLNIASPDLNVSGSVAFAADGAFRSAEFPHIADPRNDYALNIDVQPGDVQPGEAHRYAISVKGKKFDAAPLLAKSPSLEPPTHEPKLDLTVSLGRVLTGPDSGLNDVAGTASLSGGRLDLADVQAKAGGQVTLKYSPDGDGSALHFAAADAGAALAGLGLTGGVRGGSMHIDGTTINVANGQRMTTTDLEMKDFQLTDAPIIARLINAVSLTGFIDLLSGRGLNFDRLSSKADYIDGKITFRDGRSAGALGISFEGDVDLDRDKIALKGTIVPVNTLNSILAAIPVLGDILTGGNRGGLIGWTYSVSGRPDDPRVSVNPLSMFAPGFLRNLFFLGPSEPKPTVEAEPATPPEDP